MEKNKVILCQEDYNQLKQFLGTSGEYDEMSIGYELSRAEVVAHAADLPPFTVRLNSQVTIEDVMSKKESSFKLVMPGYADIKARKISVLTPMGAAIIGFRKGDIVKWKMPAGIKEFKIISVE